MTPFVSFITPSIGRKTLLSLTLPSLLAQSDSDWESIIAYDGPRFNWIDFWNSRSFDDERIRVTVQPKTYSAGLTRNTASSFAKGDWIAFLDDDDSVHPYYVSTLRAIEAEIDPDVIVFRMKDPKLGIIPHPNDSTIRHSNVGISFAVRRHFMLPEGFRFIRENISNPGIGGNEDVTILKEMEDAGLDIYVAPQIMYRVRH